MAELRKNSRYQSIAKAKIEGVDQGESLLKDISITGCRVECTAYAEMKLNTKYNVEVIPEKISQIGEFILNVESKWIRTWSYFCEIGFNIVESPKKKHFQRYVDYLSWRNSHGKSMFGIDGEEPVR